MLIPIGSKVIIKFTGETGKVVEQIDEEMFGVKLDEFDSVVPVHGVDLRMVEASAPTIHRGEPLATSPEINIQLESGFHIVFKSNDHHLINKRYTIFLANRTVNDYVYDYSFKLANETIHTESQRIMSEADITVGSMMYEDLNEKASIHLSIARLSTAGLDPWQTRTLNLKMKQFFSKQVISLSDGCIYHDYKLSGWTTIKESTKENKLQIKKAGYKKANPLVRHQVISAANFELEIDLHINQLTANPEGLDKFQKLTIQLEAMKRYVDKAKSLRIDRVFLIHGLGKGKLRSEIAKYLDQDIDILYHKNEYHPKYGFGATEVVFR